MRRKRTRDRKAARRQPFVAGHERAGDIASKHNFHAAAAEHYQDALELSTPDSAQQLRLMEKLVEQLWLGNDPVAATNINERLLSLYSRHRALGVHAANALLKLSYQQNVASKTRASLPSVAQAVGISERLHDRELQQRALVRMANILFQLGQHEDARDYINRIGNIDDMVTDKGERASYWRVKGLIEVYFSPEEEVFGYFDRAVDYARNDPDPYRPTNILADYSLAAWSFGRSTVARAYRERALLLARRANVSWLISRRCLEYADLLMRLGEPTAAYGYLMEALSAEASAPLLDATIAYVGIPLALQMNDRALLARCIRPAALEEAFSRGAPARVGFIAAAFARLYVEQGQPRKAQALLHRALQAVPVLQNGWDLSLEVARCGSLADISRARSLLAACLAMPCARVPEAYLRLFDAFVAEREGRVADRQTAASEAAARFEQFHWRTEGDLARSLLPAPARQRPAASLNAEHFSNVHATLTRREREVAMLIVKGLGNRAISQALSVTENTVEKHVASVLNKFGIRSRYQVADAITQL